MLKKLTLLLVALSVSSAVAQSSRCSTDEFLAAKFAENEALKVSYEKAMYDIRSVAKHVHSMKTSMDEQEEDLVIPVVFHIVYRFGTQNIPDLRITEQMNTLNADYAGLNTDISEVPADFTQFVGTSRIRFELASIDPDGNPTTGIERIETDSSVFSMSDEGIKHSELGGADAWNSSQYLNIWVGRIEQGILGYATPPNTAMADEDGVVIGYKYVGLSNSASYGLGRTGTHEVGHYLGLIHLWGAYGPSCTLDDGISDTPMQFEAHYVDPGHPSISCNSADMFMNYMDYVEDEDMFFFSAEQVTHMETALEINRESLLTSPALAVDENISNEVFEIFPVPVSKGSELTVVIPEGKVINQVQIVDLLGRVHLNDIVDTNDKELSLNIKELSTGVYLLKLNGEKMSYNKRIVIR